MLTDMKKPDAMSGFFHVWDLSAVHIAAEAAPTTAPDQLSGSS